jgi:hypothetical protein
MRRRRSIRERRNHKRENMSHQKAISDPNFSMIICSKSC